MVERGDDVDRAGRGRKFPAPPMEVLMYFGFVLRDRREVVLLEV